MKMQQELFVKRLEGQPNLHKRPFTTLKVAGVALLAGLIAGPMVFPKALRAQDTSTQAITTDKKQLPPDLAKLQKVSLAEMQTLDKETKGDRDWEQVPLGPDGAPTHLGWFIEAQFLYPNGSDSIKASVVIDTTNFNDGGPLKKYVGVSLNGKLTNVYDLASLDALYKIATGTELKYVKLVTFTGNDSNLGAYAAVRVVPVDKPGGEIKAGIPILTIALQAATKNLYAGENLIVMR